MKILFVVIERISHFMHRVAGVAVISIMLLTVCDVILRKLRMPFDWTYEVIPLLGVIAIGCSVPQAALDKAHIHMEFLLDRAPRVWQKSLIIINRSIAIIVFALFGWMSFPFGTSIWESGQHTQELHLPEYPLIYLLGVCCFVVCLAFFRNLVQEVKK